jgi:hypothetical protein
VKYFSFWEGHNCGVDIRSLAHSQQRRNFENITYFKKYNLTDIGIFAKKNTLTVVDVGG